MSKKEIGHIRDKDQYYYGGEISVIQDLRSLSFAGETLDGVPLDTSFCEALDDACKLLVKTLKGIVVKTTHIPIVYIWCCPVCDTENEEEGSFYDDGAVWGTCKDCGLQIKIEPE